MRVELPSGRVSQAVVGEQLTVHTWLVVREDSLTLFGFPTEDELEVFGHLIGVTGVGPRSALGVLSALTPSEIANAVAAEDEKVFRKVSGIGPKTSKLIVISLAGKLEAAAYAQHEERPVDAATAHADAVRDGLMGLGWNESAAAGAVEDAIAAGAPTDSAGLLRAALALLQAARGGAR